METIAAPAHTPQLIERPRLLAELDTAEASGARVICLVAPAGYGKTVLAQQWARSRHPDTVWHYANEASADIGYVADRLALAAERLAPGIRETVRARLRGGRDPGLDHRDLAELLAQRLEGAAAEAWVAIDDFQYLGSSAAAELVEELLNLRACRLLLTSRMRPRFATSRSVLYSECVLVGAKALEFDSDEVATLAGTGGTQTAGLAKANVPGWPVLAHLVVRHKETSGRLDDADLFSYIRDNVFSALSEEERTGLTVLSIAPSLTMHVARIAIGPNCEAVVGSALSAGLLHEESDRIGMHPLVREFLRTQFEQLPLPARRLVSRRLFAHLMREREYDDAFAVATVADDADLIGRLLRCAYREALNSGRHESVRRWLAGLRAGHPLAQLVNAELLLAEGQLDRAEGVATQAAASTGLRPKERARAWCVAGLAMFMAANVERALSHYYDALEVSASRLARANALWGAFTATNIVRPSESPAVLARFNAMSYASPTTRVRHAVGLLSLSESGEGWIHALPEARTAAAVVRDVEDPRVRTSFWCAFADVLLDAGCTGEAREALRVADDDASRHGFHFALPRLRILSVRADMLDRHFSHAATKLREAEALGRDDQDVAEAAVNNRMKLALMQGRRPKETPVPSRSRASAYLVSQSFAWSAIVNAVYGETPSASDELADRAVALCDAPYVRNVAAFARAIAQQRLELDGASRRLADATLQTIESGDVYSLVLLYRSWPGVISIALEDPRTRGAMTEIVGRFDPDLARAHSAGEGTEERPSAASRLSPRECEVLELLTDGLTNREIASLLFIAESTAKLHVRHICRKLGVRSRTEAVLQATGQPEVRQPSA